MSAEDGGSAIPIAPCDRFIGLIVRAADGSLDAASRSRLDAHLESCATCRAALAEQREAHAILAAWRLPDPSAEFAPRVLDAVRREPAWLPVFDFRRWAARLAPLAAGLALAAYLVVDRTTAVLATPAGSAATTESAPAATPSAEAASDALWASEVSDGDLVSLLLTAAADDPLTDALEESPQ